MTIEAITERLFGLESVHDCEVVRRCETDSSVQGADSLRHVAYVVPAPTVRGDRLEDWVASLRRECAQADEDGPGAACDLIAVSRLPRVPGGGIDEDLLLRLPLLDDALAKSWEDRLRSVSGVRDAMVTIAPEHEALPNLHLEDLFPTSLEWESESKGPGKSGPAAKQEDAPQEASSNRDRGATAPFERGPALSYGGDLKDANELPQTLGDTLRRAAIQHPDHGLRTIADGAEAFLSYPELLHRADCLLAGLRSTGLRPGEKVILQFTDNQGFVTAFWACVLGGFVPAPLASTKQALGEAAEKLRQAWEILDASMALTSRDLLPQLRAMLDARSVPVAKAACLEDLAAPGGSGQWHNAAAADVALLMLTSGSTGVPKAVMLTHRNLIRRAAGSAQRNGFSSEEITLNWMPLDHVAGLVYFHLRDVFLGAQQIHAATQLVTQDPLIWPEWVDRYRVTITFAPNFAFGLVNDRFDQIASRAHRGGRVWDLSCLRFLLNGAEAIVARTARRFLQIFAAYGLHEAAMWPVWGMSETSSGTLYSDAFRLESTHDEDPFVEVGRPIPGFTARIVDEAGQVVLEGQTGRLEVKGDPVTSGYYGRPDLNAEAFTSDGWFRTGDLAAMSRGSLTITGREKDVIVINSVKYACHEIEAVVEEVDGVETSFTAACGVRERNTDTEKLAIFFHPIAGVEAVTPELIRLIRSTVSRRLGLSPDYLLPVERDAIAKTSIGKIQRTQLANSFRKGAFQDVIRRVDILTAGANTLPDWFFRPVWRQAERHGYQATGPTLVFADNLGVGECLHRRVQASGFLCVLVVQGSQFSESGECFTIDPRSADHYTHLFASLEVRSFAPESVVHLWSYHEDSPQPEAIVEIEHAQTTAMLSVMRLAQALLAARKAAGALTATWPRVRLTVVSNRVQHLANDTEAPAIEKATLLGLLKTIPQEEPGLACYHLDLPAGPAEEHAGLVLNEVNAQGRDPEAAYRRGRRWVRRVERVMFAGEPVGPLPIHVGALYLLTGGLGGIGLELAGYLLKHFRANLLLIGRTELGSGAAEKRDALHSLEELATAHGGSVRYAAADATSLSHLQRLAAETEAKFSRPLDGVFHLAGAYHEGPVAEETADGMLALLRPKLGAVALQTLVAGRPGALFVSFSSVNGFLGGYGVGAYAAANAFLEGFSEFQRTSTELKAYCISWSLWDDIGMSRGYAMKEAARNRGFYAMSARQGLLSLLAILQRSPGHTLVGLDSANLHVRRIAEDLPLPARSLLGTVTGDPASVMLLAASSSTPALDLQDRYGNRTTCRVEVAAQAVLDADGRIDRGKRMFPSRTGMPAASISAPPGNALERTIAKVWRDVLGLEQIDVTDNFFDLGGTSLKLGQMNGRLQEVLGRRISMTKVFQFPSVRLLSAHLSGSEKEETSPGLGQGQSRGERRRSMVLARRR